ncbi:MAG: substrate-binding domain-containing protein [Candidatus Contendobacter sp.]|nr:substrate-binding domain-containing protein [Candidatus Contendobacter sp.]MDS4059086.1 substrate-binding domain-containing protein [Candidatus Contendobacter sp.]
MLARNLSLALVLLLAAAIGAAAEPMRDYISVAGSATIYPFATAVGEHFSQATRLKPPQIQGIGSGAGFKLFCAGAGAEALDIAIAVRPMKSEERGVCEKNGVKDIVEIQFGRIATVVAQSSTGAKFTNLTRKELFLAMAKEVPDPKDGARMVPNPYKTWKDINPALPNTKIMLWVPAAMHGTHDVAMNKIMLVGCKQVDPMQALMGHDPKALEAACQRPREDGAYVEFKEYSQAIKELQTNPNTLGIMAQNQYKQDSGLAPISLEGYEPSALSVAHGVYPVVESLLLYVKKANLGVVAGLKEYLTEFTSEAAIGTNQGYLGPMGVVTLPLTDRNQAQASVAGLAVN